MLSTKEHILAIAYQLFLQKSFKGVTMQEIVQQTGLSKGAFYHYFTSKEALFTEVIERYFTAALHTDFAALPADTLRAFYQQYAAKLAAEQPVASGEGVSNINAYALIFEALRVLPDFQQTLLHYKEQELNAWLTVVGRAQVSGEIKPRPSADAIARLFMYAQDGAELHVLMTRQTATELLPLWDDLYALLRV